MREYTKAKKDYEPGAYIIGRQSVREATSVSSKKNQRTGRVMVIMMAGGDMILCRN